MSKVGFRREVLGFNRNDVIEYIRKTQQETSKREKDLVETLDKLNIRNAELIDELKKIPELEAKLKISEATIKKMAEEAIGLEEKKAELDSISNDIAKMYLVSKSNAESIRISSRESSELAFYEIKQTLEAIERIQEKLNSLKAQVTGAANAYSREIDILTSSLSGAKEKIDTISQKADEITQKVNV